MTFRHSIAEFIVAPRVYLRHRRLKRLRSIDKQERLDLQGDRDIEWSWVASRLPNGPGKVLDFGNGESALGLIASRRGFHVTAVDLRPARWPYVHDRLTFVQGDLMELSWDPDYFDLVINCSTVEHVGLAGRYGITKERTDGDLEVMARLHELMKANAVMILTVPIGRDSLFPPLHRVYGSQRLPALLAGYSVEAEEYWIKDNKNRWVSCTQTQATNFEAQPGYGRAIEMVYALGCFVLRCLK